MPIKSKTLETDGPYVKGKKLTYGGYLLYERNRNT